MGRDKGFTLVEILAVLLLMGVVSAVLLSGGLGSNADESSAADVLKSHLRYAQSRSMNGDVSWGIQFNGGSYQLIKDVTGTPQTITLPGEGRQSVSLPASVTGSVAFDSWGRPSGLASISLGGRTITITPDTGFIP
jgi:MSHA pilin protein MshC